MIENLRYEGGAPPGWAWWLQPQSVVSINWDKDGVLILGQIEKQQIAWSQIRSLRVDPPQTKWEATVPGHASRSPRAMVSLSALCTLPKRPYEYLVVSLDTNELIFDVRDRRVPQEELLSTAEALALREIENFIILIRDGSYRWVHVKRFQTASGPSSSSKETLRKLLANPAYWDKYTSAQHNVSPGIHGPYRLDALSPELFEPVELAAAQSDLDGWLTQYGPVEPTDIRGDLSTVRHLIANANERFLLPELADEARYNGPTGPSVLHSGFLELVLLHDDGVISLLVASGD